MRILEEVKLWGCCEAPVGRVAADRAFCQERVRRLAGNRSLSGCSCSVSGLFISGPGGSSPAPSPRGRTRPAGVRPDARRPGRVRPGSGPVVRRFPVPGAPQRRVRAVRRHQLVVGAQFGEPAVLHHRDPVRVVGGVQPVGDGDHRAAVAARRPARARCAGRSPGRAGPSPRPGSACAGRPAPPGPAPVAGPASRPYGGRSAPRSVSSPSGSSRAQSGADRAPAPPTAPSSVAAGSAISRLSRTVPRKTWCSWVTSTTWRRSCLRRQVGDRHPADGHRARARRVHAREQPAQRGLAGARTGPTTASRSPGRTVRSTPCSTSPPRS